MEVHIICGSRVPCGFRVHDQYFRLKSRFAPGICPRCNGPISIVEAYTEVVIPGAYMSLLKPGEGGGQVLGISAPMSGDAGANGGGLI